MTLPAKVAAAVGVIGGGSLAGCYFGGVFNDTPWVSLKKEGGSYSGKVGEKYSVYLLAVHGVGDAEEKDANKVKWEELHKVWSRNKGLTGDEALSIEFGQDKVEGAYEAKGAASGTGSSGKKPLNKVCEDLYKNKNVTDFDLSIPSTHTAKDDKYKLTRDFLRYCSPLGQKPVVIGDSEKFSGGLAETDTSLKPKLVSTSNRDNYYFWEAQERRFISENETSNTNRFFVVDGENKTLKFGLKNMCNKAYTATEVSTSTDEKLTKNEVEKYCTFSEVTNS